VCDLEYFWVIVKMAAMEVDLPPENLPWVEKYRPSCLNDLISHKDIIGTIEKIYQRG